MNRWWGSKSDSNQQASARDQRAARRIVNTLDLRLSDDEELDFQDCDTSINNISIFSNVDGADDIDELESVADASTVSMADGSNFVSLLSSDVFLLMNNFLS